MLKRFGRPFFTKPSHEVLEEQRAYWGRFVRGDMSELETLSAYFAKKLDIMCVEHFKEAEQSGGGTSKSSLRFFGVPRLKRSLPRCSNIPIQSW